MYSIILRTPPDKYNGEYSAHLIEHMKLYPENTGNYFHITEKIQGFSYTFYTEYLYDTGDRHLVEEFVKYLIAPLEHKNFLPSKKSIQEELREHNIHKKTIEKIGKEVYGETYSYGKNSRRSFDDISAYQTKYYKKDSIEIICIDMTHRDHYTQFSGDIALENLIIDSNTIKVSGDTYIFFSSVSSPVTLFIYTLLEDFFDSYLRLCDTQDGFYFYRSTQQGEFEEIVWMTIKRDIFDDLMSIPTEFIDQYMRFYGGIVKERSTLAECDRVSLLQYGAHLSHEQKIYLIAQLGTIYNILVEILAV